MLTSCQDKLTPNSCDARCILVPLVYCHHLKDESSKWVSKNTSSQAVTAVANKGEGGTQPLGSLRKHHFS